MGLRLIGVLFWIVAVLASAASPSRATPLSSPDCDEARGWNLTANLRDARGGATLWFQDPAVAALTIEDGQGWSGTQAYYFELSWVAVTGTLRFGVDLSRNRVLEATEVLSRTFDSYMYRSFLRAGIELDGRDARVTDLTVNGTAIGTLAVGDRDEIERDILRTNQAMREILITGTLVVTGDRHGGDWPEMSLRLGDDAAFHLQVSSALDVREPTTIATLGLGLAGWTLMRRRRRAVA